jgi:hypothetical protein
MRSKSNEDYELEEEGYDHSENTTLDTKDFKCEHKVDSMTKLKASMKRLKQPPLEKDFSYFMKIGLSGARTNLNKLKVGKDVPQEKLMETFNKATLHSRF